MRDRDDMTVSETETRKVAAQYDGEEPVHVYLSTYCLHERHGDCRRTCKICEAECVCRCHD